uniref:Uncharacterized protein n=1 Tax=Lepeophtheirus salmonis TaxID=72036 RepID=A0A0K2UHR4_LEPSM
MAPHESLVGFSSQIAHILLVNKAIAPKMCLIAEDDFMLNIRIIFEFSFSPFYQFLTFEVVKRLQLLCQLDLIGVYAKMFSQNSPLRCHRDAQRLRTARKRQI